MKKYFIDNNSDNLLIFFAGWGCDEYEFEHLNSKSNILILYDYLDLNLDFDFSKYKNFNLLAFSAGVFVASVLDFDFEINKKIAISGNPYLFDEHFGLSKEIQEILYNITEENADEFGRNYLVKTDAEWNNFHPSKRTLESCQEEFDCLKTIYKNKKGEIKDIYDYALAGEEDPIFNVTAQKEFYGERLKVIKNARHNIFFRINSYGQIFDLNI
jgi:biotin synthesis protein BioG